MNTPLLDGIVKVAIGGKTIGHVLDMAHNGGKGHTNLARLAKINSTMRRLFDRTMPKSDSNNFLSDALSSLRGWRSSKPQAFGLSSWGGRDGIRGSLFRHVKLEDGVKPEIGRFFHHLSNY